MAEVKKPVAVIGARELAMGMRLIGIRDTFIGVDTDGAKELLKLVDGGRFSMILADQQLRKHLSEHSKTMLEKTLEPLVVFLPTPGSEEEGESVDALAKRVLGVSIDNLSDAKLT